MLSELLVWRKMLIALNYLSDLINHQHRCGALEL